jgi:hypothetical protein
MAGTAIKRPWSAADARTLKSLARRTTAARSIAKQLRRTEGAIPPTIFGHMQLPLRLNDRSSQYWLSPCSDYHIRKRHCVTVVTHRTYGGTRLRSASAS